MSKLKKRILKHLADDIYCRLGISSLHGIGVFAIRAIPKGADPLRCMSPNKEVSIHSKDIKKLDKSVKELIKTFCYYKDDEVLVSTMGLNTMNIAFYLNHSKEPNVRMKKDESFEALRDIAEGEELLMDYDKSFGETHIFT